MLNVILDATEMQDVRFCDGLSEGFGWETRKRCVEV
jgi:hypothetical protein